MKKGFGIMLIGFAWCLWLYSATPSAAVVTLKMGTIAGPSSLEGQGASLFGKLVEQKTKGEVKVNVGYSSAFGGLANLLQSIEMGSVDLMVSSIDQWEFLDPALRILRFNYVFRDYDHYTKYLNSPIADESNKKLLERNHRILLPQKNTFWLRGPYRVLVSKKPVFTAEDVKGLRLRLYESETAKKVWGQALGATIAVIPWAETYLALRQGMVEAVTSPIDALLDAKFTETCKYVTNVNEFFQTNTIAINEKRWKSFSPALQKAINEAAAETAAKMSELTTAQVDKDIQTMMDSHGASFIRVSLRSFVEKVRPLIDEMENQNVWPKGLFNRIQEIK
jgi:TRAP-type C4-dicarboxylate transport system substrate-binding protein